MRKLRAAALPLLAALLLSGCGGVAAEPEPLPQPESPKEKYTGTMYDAFDTIITVTAYCDSQEQFDALMDTAETEFLRFHRLFDIYYTYPGLNNLKTVNDSAGQAPVEVPEDILSLLELAKEMYELTGGAVNVAMGGVLQLWHDVREYNLAFPEDMRLPDPEALNAAAAHRSQEDLVLDREAGTVLLRDPEMRLDVGAVAKGYAVEHVARALLAQGFESAAINAGGNVRVLGPKPDGSPWLVGVTNPDMTSGQVSLGTVECTGGSVVTSGTYQRFFEYEGRRYHHIIDGDTLMPENRWSSLTVLMEDSARADALSTALFNMDYEEGAALVASLEGVEAMWVTPEGEILLSPGFSLTS